MSVSFRKCIEFKVKASYSHKGGLRGYYVLGKEKVHDAFKIVSYRGEQQRFDTIEEANARIEFLKEEQKNRLIVLLEGK